MNEAGRADCLGPPFAFSGYLISIFASLATFFQASMSRALMSRCWSPAMKSVEMPSASSFSNGGTKKNRSPAGKRTGRSS
jgi:hypothetical protein